ncbi:MAG: hypothetical protein LBG74_03360 [Spirochaetaceae bacterium]|jgi:hypothetical protein|nr:hypothetical protein [Spirochaetaceae bacterium]
MPVFAREKARLFFLIAVFGSAAFFQLAAQDEAAPADETAAPAGETADTDSTQPRPSFFQPGEEAPAEIFSWQRGNSGISLFLDGFWNWTLTGSLGWTYNSLGWRSESVPPVLFTQEADVTLSALLMDRWFAEGRFQEEAKLNSYRAGYRGKAGEFVQYVGIGNTGLDFPAFPYLNLGGNSPASLGVYGKFGGGQINLHALFRYDDASREERVFTGSRERYENYKSVRDIYRGASFVLPDDRLNALPLVYIEDKNGALTGSDGRRYRRAGASEAAVSARFGLIELSGPAEGRVVVYYEGVNMGRYGNVGVLGTGYLGDVQAYFDRTGTQFNLEDYPQPGASAGKPGTIWLEGREALVIYEKGTFSPFERQSRYEAPVNDTAAAYLVDAASDTALAAWSLELYHESESIDINDADFLTRYARRIYELRGASFAGGGDRARQPAALWPLADAAAGTPAGIAAEPALYLPDGGDPGNVRLKFISFGAVGGYQIGSNVIESSIQVTRSGLVDTGFVFDAASGVVRLERPAFFNETIRISFLRLNAGGKAGSIAGGLGFTWESEPVREEEAVMAAGAAIGGRWNVAQDSFSQDNVTPGKAGLGAYFQYTKQNLELALRLGASYGAEDTAGMYRIAGMEGNERIFRLAAAESEVSAKPEAETGSSAEAVFSGLALSGRAALVYRDYTGKDFLNSGELLPVENNAPVISGKNAPYPVRDKALASDTLAAEFSLNDEAVWTGWTAKLPEGFVENVSEIEIPFRFYEIIGGGSFSVYAQIGELAADGGAFYDNPALTVSKKIFPVPDTNVTLSPSFPGALPDSVPHLASYKPDTAERRRLRGATALRIVIVRETGTPALRMLTAQPIMRGAAWEPLSVNAGIVDALPEGISAVEIPDASLAQSYGGTIKRLHPNGEKQRVLNVSWEQNSALAAAGAGARLAQIPFSAYRRMAFFARLNEPAGAFEIILAEGTDAYSKSAKQYFRALIPAGTFARGKWALVEARYGGSERGIFVDGVYAAAIEWGAVSLYNVNSPKETDAAPYLMFFQHSPGVESSFEVDEVTLTESDDAFTGNAGISAEWRRPGTIAGIRGFPLLANARLRADSEAAVIAWGIAVPSGGDGLPSNQQKGEASFANATLAEIEIAGFQLKGEAAFSGGGETLFWKGGHSIGRFWGPAGFEERFFIDPFNKQWLHGAALFLSGKMSAVLAAESKNETEFARDWTARFGVSGRPDFSVNAGLSYTSPADTAFSGNYGAVWAETWPALLPDAGSDAGKRKTQASLAFNPGQSAFLAAGSNAAWGAALTLDGSAAFTRSLGVSGHTNGAEAAFPFTFGGNRASFSIKRRFERSLFQESASEIEDLALFGGGVADALPLYGQIPFYALFDPDGGERFNKSVTSADTAITGSALNDSLFRDEYRISFQLAPFHPLVPRDIDGYIRRDLSRKLDSLADTFVTGGAVHHSAVNIAGAFSRLALFPFYQNDEFDSVVSAEWSIPKDGAVRWKAQSAQSFFFYGFKGSEIEFEDLVSVHDAGYGLFFGLYWTAPAEKSLFGKIYDAVLARFGSASVWTVFTELKARPVERLRREKAEFTLNETDGYSTMQISAGHESIIRIAGNFTFKAFVDAGFSHTEKTETLNILLSAGIALNMTW